MIGELVARLISAGTEPTLAAQVVAEAFAAGTMSGGSRVDVSAERRRAWDREYRRKQRENPPESTRLRPMSETTISILEGKEEKKEPKKERSRGEKIPPDWKPNPEHIASGRKLGFTESQITEQAEDMRLWAQSNEHRAVARKSDWDMTFLGWLRRNKPKNGAGNGHGNPTMEAFDRLIARAESAEIAGDDLLVDVTPRSAGSG